MGNTGTLDYSGQITLHLIALVLSTFWTGTRSKCLCTLC